MQFLSSILIIFSCYRLFFVQTYLICCWCPVRPACTAVAVELFHLYLSLDMLLGHMSSRAGCFVSAEKSLAVKKKQIRKLLIHLFTQKTINPRAMSCFMCCRVLLCGSKCISFPPCPWFQASARQRLTPLLYSREKSLLWGCVWRGTPFVTKFQSSSFMFERHFAVSPWGLVIADL